MNKALILGVIYPGVGIYLNDYFDSLQNQSDPDFDLLIINDGIRDLSQIPFTDHAKWIDCNLNSPVKTRAMGIQYALKHNYDILITSDADDFFSENRVASAKENLQAADFMVNELELVTEDGLPVKSGVLSDLKIEKRHTKIDTILDRNFFGFSNTAFRLDKLDGFYIPDNTIAVDWWFFSCLLLNGCQGVFSGESKTFYRQHDENTVGLRKPLDEKRLRFGIEVKLRHYSNLSGFCKKNALNIELFSSRAGQMEELLSAVENPEFRERYLTTINTRFNKIFTGWWSEIIPVSKMEQL